MRKALLTERELNILCDIVSEAGKLALSYKYAGLRVERKEDTSLVSDADRAVEKRIVERLTEAFPKYPVVGEESAGHDIGYSDSDFRTPHFYVDPIDGTTNFINGLVAWGVSIGFVDGYKEPHAGAIYIPELNQIYLARTGRGATRNGVPIEGPSANKPLEQIVLAYAHPAKKVSDWGTSEEVFYGIQRAQKYLQTTRAHGAAVFDCVMVANGTVDAVWASGLKPWDTCAGLIIMREAGLQITNPAGEEMRTPFGSFIATRPEVHQEVRSILLDADQHPL